MHVDDNRVRFRFDERPERETTAKMKRAGFRWSRRHGAWQRQLNEAGRFAARRMAEELFGWQEPEPARTDESASDDVEAAARWQAQVKADHAALMERRAREEAEGRPSPRLSDEQVFDELRARAAITDEDRARYPGDVIEEAEASGLRPERVLELRAMSEREESEMGQRLRGAARRGDL